MSPNSDIINGSFAMKLNRRSFLKKTLAAGSLLAGAGSFIAACSGVGRNKLPEPELAEQTPHWLDKVRNAVLYYASLAPSGHNSQPWYLRVLDQNEWVIGVDPLRRLPAVDPHNRETLLSIGAFAENLVAAAGTFGLNTELEVLAADPFEQDILKVYLSPAKAVDYPLQRIAGRMTVKHGYLPAEIKKDDLDVLSKPFNGQMFYFPRGSEHADCIAEGAVEYFRRQSQRDDAQQELVTWLRLSNADADRYRDGLTVEDMEIQGFKGWFVRNFVKPEDFLKPDFRKQGVDHTARLARQGGGWIVITSRDRTVADLIETGRRFERMALLAFERNIALQPMTQYLEEAAGLNQIVANHRPDMIPQFLLRTGYLKRYPQPVSLRRPVSWFLRVN
jgi:hypothetical protein